MEDGMTDKGEKKAYATPKLVAYGDIRTITRSVGDKGNNDGGAVYGYRRTDT